MNNKKKGMPNGNVRMIFIPDKKDCALTGSSQDSVGKENILYSLDKADLSGDEATLDFNASGYDVNLEMGKKDDEHVTESLMGMLDAEGQRVKYSN